ncbi:hypothetical protein ATK36_4344 [Amycolatopsis sulphurea]|uniref:Uncharacterized protein n=1 Tax=Amycolatopsis sulphurea TaxID=76022 RepID=A0A2A9FFJ5_9PSEU|nr:hypothetical protein ATK36_4344 [Amycolatopsis sulphurea]
MRLGKVGESLLDPACEQLKVVVACRENSRIDESAAQEVPPRPRGQLVKDLVTERTGPPGKTGDGVGRVVTADEQPIPNRSGPFRIGESVDQGA